MDLSNLNLKKILLPFLSLIILFISLGLITYLWWQILANWYLHLPSPIGGDYYTGLTYAKYFAQHLPLPPSGWLAFWNGGGPLIGGYQWLTFYLMAPLLFFATPLQALNWYSVIAILLFHLFSYLLYLQISKNYFVALGLTLIGLTSQAVYYQLTSGGMITGSSMQFYLPLSLLFLYRHFDLPKSYRNLLISSVICGLSLIHHPAMSLLFVILPVSVVLVTRSLIVSTSRIAHRVSEILIFIFTTSASGTLGLWPFFNQMSFSEIATTCDNSQCWGIYPFHLERWLGWLPFIVSGLSLLFVLGAKLVYRIFKRSLSIRSTMPLLFASVVLLLYPFGAYLHLLNSLANSLFPRRMFWAVLVLLLTLAAQNFKLLTRANRYFGWLMSTAFISILPFVLPWQVNSLTSASLIPKFLTDPPNAAPNYIHKIILPEYRDISYKNEQLPAWLTPENPQYRLDSNDATLTHWWNLISDIPVTRGYTSGFNAKSSDWTYYLQTALSVDANQNVPPQLIENRARFLFDAFGIGFVVNDKYHTDLQKEELYAKYSNRISQLKPQFTSPIIEPTTALPILFIGDDSGYSTFIRALALTNLNSSKLIPVKGPTSLSKLSPTILATFPSLFLYRFQGDLKLLVPYLKSGGKVFLELGSNPNLSHKFPSDLPLARVKEKSASAWNLQIDPDSKLVKQIDPQQFSPLLYQNQPWKYSTFDPSKSNANTTVLLRQDEEPVLVDAPIEKGRLFVSGLNLPFHLVEYLNQEETSLFANILETLVIIPNLYPQAQVIRYNSEKIEITGKKFNGVYFKENFHPGWQAKINDTAAPVFEAGLNFMYIPIPQTPNQIHLQLEFTGGFGNWIWFYINLLSLVVISVLILFPKLTHNLSSFISLPLSKLASKRISTLQTDEHLNY
ncbi:MAG: hypothetical protein UV61_C0003G0044 [Candidatus Gottesmanbacteria bacterium GW2011_GWB1_43_11]|uniref:Membrane protein 6-pyruvoyl-tetrahydropterin synthase-related domain-containing protein n=1 Tax=Candidatus Gottesmanbacteria bacterium GW2011_GWB1_43_11 TaxID=1618446 RepID=A0A0G1EVZ6_9BACT|nr:MAG: hypothetical protein UV04_C0002G0045 [Candidatus Gottesmanbacteria bacterium GW2011_GWA2_42_16]KKS56147.1 MAG: hypothetical protein UV17_C0002G0044 [Candidatus Gottesmanbacteria bacterium GW2011_GWA1_42_26]KKS82468.1 MAG: hypothetical protein UV55_C0002G0046 [Candidatus Gottesmanbacteria bacterium GW2011_GWC1_43_10]KKS87191.1 MAG: hypothetical protein UV61_C0003G0044 [Candidatus Gottesmanbacteria bacterium GW2011_GWB1_43_11]